MVSFPFPLLQVTKSGSWLWLCDVRLEWFALSDALDWLVTKTWVSASHPAVALNKAKKSWIWHCSATRKGCWASVPQCARKRRHVPTHRRGRRLVMGSAGV